MAQKKGQTGNPNGRPKGSKNRSTERAREAIAKFVDRNTARFDVWLEEIYQEEGAKEAFKCVEGLLEYHVPKLSRQEQQLVDKDGNDRDINVTINKIVRDDGDTD